MSSGPVTKFLQVLRTDMLRLDPAQLTDEQLLAWYVERRDEAAFAAIVRRHGPLVMGVCGRVLADRHDAEDAFQATFLVLVRKAARIASREQLANWLYGVAYNVARKARAAAAKRRAREKQVAVLPERAAVSRPPDWLPLLDQELSRLPEKYRVPILLCDLQGQAHKAAGELLGWPIGTVSGRLARGRMLLARRLARHGLGLTVASLTALLAEQTATASVGSSVVASTVRAATLFAAGRAVSPAAAALTYGALRTMTLDKLKVVAPLVLAAGLALGVGVSNFRAGTGQLVAQQTQPDAPKADGNILRNAGIEEGGAAPTHWSQGADLQGVEYIYDKKAGFKSKSSLCLHKTAQRYFPIAQWYQIVDRQGDSPRLKVSAQVRAEQATKAILDVAFLGDDGEVFAHEWAAYIGAKEANDPPANHDWQEYAGTVKVPPGTKKIQVGLQIYGPGKVWFDDIRAEYAK